MIAKHPFVEAAVTFIVFSICCASVWAASPAFTGQAEPWDDEGPYYIGALALVGFCAGLAVGRPSIFMYLGAIFGQLGYMIIFRRVGPLILIGAFFVAVYSLLPTFTGIAGAAIRMLLRGGEGREEVLRVLRGEWGPRVR